MRVTDWLPRLAIDVEIKTENLEAKRRLRPRKTAMAGGAWEKPSSRCGLKHDDDDKD